jgi:hypothetical protein
MKTAARHTRVVLCLLASAAGLVLATLEPLRRSHRSWARMLTFSDSFSGPLDCQGELYAFNVTGHTVVHATYFEETRALHFHLVDHGKAVAIPLDGTGPSYAASFLDFDLENIRAIRHGDAFVEEETDLLRTVAHGSDGSRLFFYLHVRSR